MNDLSGNQFGQYQILELLGQGGMASVYKAMDIKLNREVAIKVISQSGEDAETFFKRFEREAKALAKLSHSNIIKIYDFGEEGGIPYIAMEYMGGGTLLDYLNGPMEVDTAAQIMIPIARAVDYAHQQGMYHRDIKPSNILFTDQHIPVLSDFGIAKKRVVDEETQLTQIGHRVGTLEYMAPEQMSGRQEVDHRVDIYSLGAVLYELVTGHRPYEAENVVEVVRKMQDPLVFPRVFVPDLNSDIERVIVKALAKSPDDRYQEAGKLADDLERLLTQLTEEVHGDFHDGSETVVDQEGETEIVDFVPESIEEKTARGLGGLESQTLPAAMPASPDAVRKKTGRPWVWIVGGVILMIALACVVLLGVSGLSSYMGWKIPGLDLPELLNFNGQESSSNMPVEVHEGGEPDEVQEYVEAATPEMPTIIREFELREVSLDEDIRQHEINGNDGLGMIVSADEFASDENDLKLDKDEGLLWSVSWCAERPELARGSDQRIEYLFLINGESIHSPMTTKPIRDHDNGRFCISRYFLLEDWEEGLYILEVQMILVEGNNDGTREYHPGTYINTLRVSVD